ncbi:DUF4551 domain-containing protein [Acidobacteria bacterium AH-259-A15]|nr:DUF4551 domain-containing protein [Acidobacteria bacterium AH-259-A15]
MTGEEMCEVFERALPNFTKFLDKNDPPFIAVIYKNGSIKLIYDLPSFLKDQEKAQ